MTDPSEPKIFAYFANDEELVEACRRRAAELGKSYKDIDDLANLSEGHTGHLLAVPQLCRFGPISRFAVPWALEMRFALVEDRDAMREAKRRDERAVRRGKSHFRNAKALSMLESFARENGKKGAIVRLQKLSPERRSAIARKAARARWRRVGRAENVGFSP